MRIVNLEENIDDILTKLLKRGTNQYGTYEKSVNDILSDVRERGDKAVYEYTERFDKAVINDDNFIVSEEEFEEAYEKIDKKLLNVIRKAIVNIRDYHEKQKRTGWFDTQKKGILLGQKITPLERVGVYVPGGKAAYPSSVLMSIVTAKVAGVDEIIVTTPPDREGKVYEGTLVAAREAGAVRVY